MKNNMKAIIWSLLFHTLNATILFDRECDWIGQSTMSGNAENVIQKVDVHCQSGMLSWRSGKGGLRVTFNPPPEIAASSFEVCLLINNYGINVFQETAKGLTVLQSRYVNNIAEGNDKPLCVQSEFDEVTLYFEPIQSLIGSLRVDYVVEADSTVDLHHRKCPDDELAKTFCSSDFAVKGQVLHVSYDTKQKLRHLDVKTSLVFHQTAHIFKQKEAQDEKHKFGIINAPWNFHFGLERNYVLIGNLTQKYGAHVVCYAKHHQWRNILPLIKCNY